MPVQYQKLKVNRDARGAVFEPLEEAALSRQRNVHVVISEPGTVRGNHYHHQGEETMAVMGPALVAVRDRGEIEEIEVPPGEVYAFFFPAGQSHAVKNLSTGINVLAAFNTLVHDPQHPDTETDVLLA